MSSIFNFSVGIKSFFKAIPFIFQNKMGWSFLVPLIIGAALFVFGFSVSNYLSSYAFTYLQSLFQFNDWKFEGAGYIVELIEIVVWIVIKLFFFLFFSFTVGYLMLMLISPLLAYLSEKTEEILTGESYPFKWDQFIRDITRGIGIALKNLFLEIGITLILFLISFIPIVGLATPFLLFAVSSYFYGYSFLDYNLERKKLNASKSLQVARKNSIFTLSLGVPFSLIIIIPYLGTILAGFAAIISTVGASMATHQISTENRLKN